MKHRGLSFDEWILTVVEKAIRILHIPNRPERNLLREHPAFQIPVRKQRQRVDGLSGALDVHRVSAVVVVLRATAIFEECRREISQASLEVRAKFIVAARFKIAVQAVEVVASMKVVDPMKFWLLGIPPRAVGQLPGAAVLHR